MDVAIIAAHESEPPDRRFGAAVVAPSGGRLLAIGYNCEHALRDPTAHAEIVAIRAACDYHGHSLEGCTLFSTHELCAMCITAAGQARIGQIVMGSMRDDRPDLFRARAISVFDLARDCRVPPKLWFARREECLDLLPAPGSTW